MSIYEVLAKILYALLRLIGAGDPPKGELSIAIGPVSLSLNAEEPKMLILTDEQKCALSIQPLTAAGNPAPVDGVPTWSVSDESVLSLTVAPDGMSATIGTPGGLGTSQVSVVADADLGEGVVNITAVLDVEVKASQAVSLGMTVGVPELE